MGKATCAACLVALLATACQGADVSADPQQWLQDQKGLRPLGKTRVWVLELELNLRRRMNQLPRLEASIQSNERELHEKIVGNRRIWELQQPQLQRLEALRQSLPASDQREQVDRQLRTLRNRATPPAKLGARRDMRARLVGLSNDRTELTIAVIWIRKQFAILRQRYQELQEDEDVAEAIAKLGEKHRLGPDKDYSKQVARFERLVFTDWTPLYQQSRQWRFSVMVNEQCPLTLTWLDTPGPLVLTSAMAEASGITQTQNAPAEQLTCQGRVLRVHRIAVKELRIGRFLLRNVSALVLPPEAEDLGGQIGSDALPSLHVEPQPAALRLVIREP